MSWNVTPIEMVSGVVGVKKDQDLLHVPMDVLEMLAHVVDGRITF